MIGSRHLTRIKLVNFKSWRELDMDLGPITILFGANSSGKSSVIQSILLLLQSFENRRDLYFGGSENSYVDLGSFRDVVFKHNISEQVKIRLYDETNFSNFAIGHVDPHETVSITLSDSDIDPYHWFQHHADENTLHYLGPIRERFGNRAIGWPGTYPLKLGKYGRDTIVALIASQKRGDSLLNMVDGWLEKVNLANEFRLDALDTERQFYKPMIRQGNVESSLLDVGFGVSQVLPVITLLFFVPKHSIVLLEQPELHLHPRAQSQLADLMLHVAEERGLQLIVESHSEHLLTRLQRRIAEVEYSFATPENIKMYFCEAGEDGSKIHAVTVNDYGQITNWPEGFFGDRGADLEAMTRAGIERRRRELNGG